VELYLHKFDEPHNEFPFLALNSLKMVSEDLPVEFSKSQSNFKTKIKEFWSFEKLSLGC
jgi:hypothetical protein